MEQGSPQGGAGASPLDGASTASPSPRNYVQACTVCGAESKFHCARCQGDVIARYCSRECQREHWPRHKSVCGSDDPCPLCLERAEDDGAHVLCFACGFASCETCKEKWVQGYCPSCKADQVEVKDKACLLQKVLEAKPDHTIANYRLGLYYLRGQEGVSKDSDKALFHLERAFEKGIADAGIPIYNLRKDRGEVALGWLAKALRSPKLSAANRASVENDLKPMLDAMEKAGQISEGLSVAEFLDNVEGMMNMPPPPPSPGAPTEPTPPAAPAADELAGEVERLRSARADAQTRMEQLAGEPPSAVFLTGD